MYSIRKYNSSDLDTIQQICLSEPSDNPQMDQAILTCFCNYYVFEEPENCFVIADAQDRAVGYVLCASSFCKWKKVLNEKYVKDCTNPFTIAIAQSTINALKPHSVEYPAHLHIDLLPECQGKHLGSELIQTLIKQLTEEHVKGLMLDVAKDNIGAQHFYTKNGFKELSFSDQECTMGINLGQEDYS